MATIIPESKKFADLLEFEWVGSNEGAPGKFIVEQYGNEENGNLAFVLKAGRCYQHRDMTNEVPLAAGTFGQDGTVVEWISYHFNVTTPTELREIIGNLLSRNREVIAENWDD